MVFIELYRLTDNANGQSSHSVLHGALLAHSLLFFVSCDTHFGENRLENEQLCYHYVQAVSKETDI